MHPSKQFAALAGVRARLACHDLTFTLHREHDGYSWDIPERPMYVRRRFSTAAEALDHADFYTRVWWPDRAHEFSLRMDQR